MRPVILQDLQMELDLLQEARRNTQQPDNPGNMRIVYDLALNSLMRMHAPQVERGSEEAEEEAGLEGNSSQQSQGQAEEPQDVSQGPCLGSKIAVLLLWV